MRRQRVDFLLYVLSDSLVLDYRRMQLRIKQGFASRRLDAAEQRRHKQAEEIDAGEASIMVKQQSDVLVSRFPSS
jgi:hypothetical protein